MKNSSWIPQQTSKICAVQTVRDVFTYLIKKFFFHLDRFYSLYLIGYNIALFYVLLFYLRVMYVIVPWSGIEPALTVLEVQSSPLEWPVNSKGCGKIKHMHDTHSSSYSYFLLSYWISPL